MPQHQPRQQVLRPQSEEEDETSGREAASLTSPALSPAILSMPCFAAWKGPCDMRRGAPWQVHATSDRDRGRGVVRRGSKLNAQFRDNASTAAHISGGTAERGRRGPENKEVFGKESHMQQGTLDAARLPLPRSQRRRFITSCQAFQNFCQNLSGDLRALVAAD